METGLLVRLFGYLFHWTIGVAVFLTADKLYFSLCNHYQSYLAPFSCAWNSPPIFFSTYVDEKARYSIFQQICSWRWHIVSCCCGHWSSWTLTFWLICLWQSILSYFLRIALMISYLHWILPNHSKPIRRLRRLRADDWPWSTAQQSSTTIGCWTYWGLIFSHLFGHSL